MRISDWSSDVCSSDLNALVPVTAGHLVARLQLALHRDEDLHHLQHARRQLVAALQLLDLVLEPLLQVGLRLFPGAMHGFQVGLDLVVGHRELPPFALFDAVEQLVVDHRSEEHTSELQSLMRISYAVFCLKKKKKIL